MYRHSIIRLFLLISIIFLFTITAQSQSSDSLSLREGTWALQFGIDRYFTLTSFQGSTIGAKYQLSETNAIRGGITIGGSTNNGSNTISGATNTIDLGSVPGNSSSKSVAFNFIIQYVWYMNSNKPVHFYAGLGPMVTCSYSKNSVTSNRINISGSDGYWMRQQYESKYIQQAIGAAAVVGVEWFACQWLSLHADYNEGIQYQWGSSSNNDYEFPLSDSSLNPTTYKLDSSGSSKGWVLNNLGVSFGLNIYL